MWPIPVLSTQPTCSLTYEIQYGRPRQRLRGRPYVPIWAAALDVLLPSCAVIVLWEIRWLTLPTS